MKSENFVIIQGWMCNELDLKGNELLVYALIYGFSQDRVTRYCGGRKYIAETFNISLPTVDKALQKLLDLGYIFKETSGDYIHPDTYYINEGVVKKLYQGSKETLHRNIDKKKKEEILSKDNISENSLIESKLKKPNLYEKCIALINAFTDDEILREYLIQFLKVCLENSKESGQAFYTNTFKGKLNKLKQLSGDNYKQREIVLQTLDNGWNSFYEIKEKKNFRSGSAVSSDMGFERKRAAKKDRHLAEDIKNGKAEKF